MLSPIPKTNNHFNKTKQDWFKTGFKIAVRTGLLTRVFVFMVVKKDAVVFKSFKALNTKS